MMCFSVFINACHYFRFENFLGTTNAFLTRLSIFLKRLKKKRTDNLSPHVCSENTIISVVKSAIKSYLS